MPSPKPPVSGDLGDSTKDVAKKIAEKAGVGKSTVYQVSIPHQGQFLLPLNEGGLAEGQTEAHSLHRSHPT